MSLEMMTLNLRMPTIISEMLHKKWNLWLSEVKLNLVRISYNFKILKNQLEIEYSDMKIM